MFPFISSCGIYVMVSAVMYWRWAKDKKASTQKKNKMVETILNDKWNDGL